MRRKEYWKIPPRVKVLEALGAIADGRVKLVGEYEAAVTSSMGDRVYKVRWNGGSGIVSNDNGSVYRGYLGYPAIAFLMLKGVLPFDKRIAEALRGIPWKEINEKFKSYRLVEAYIKEKLRQKGVRPKEVDNAIRSVIEAIVKLKPHKIPLEGL